MNQITVDEGLQAAFDSMFAERLVMLLGAGLSMAPPSRLPSAADIALKAQTKYSAVYGGPALPNDVEAQAEHFFAQGKLASVYFGQLIDQHAFAGRHNDGHEAVADFLLVGAATLALTTNVDTMIEDAGHYLFGQVEARLDGDEAAALAPTVSPLLKLHGCRSRDPDNMVWAPGQLTASPVQDRIAKSASYIANRLLGRDVLIVGYWTDWDYLNAALASALGTVTPARVIVVDPCDSISFATKAPDLYAMGGRSARFDHVQLSGADFLDRLRRKFNESFFRQTASSGAAGFLHLRGTAADPAWLSPPALSARDGWQVRRDIEGRVPREPATKRSPNDNPLLGLTFIQLREAGGSSEGPLWRVGGRLVRVVNAAGKLLHAVEGDYAGEDPPAIAPDIVIAVGAEDVSLPSSVARGSTAGTIARGPTSTWMSRQAGLTALGI